MVSLSGIIITTPSPIAPSQEIDATVFVDGVCRQQSSCKMDLIAKCRKKRCINTRLLFLLLSAVALIRAYYFSGHLQDSTTTKRTHLDFHGPMIDIRGSSSSSSSSSSSKHHRLSSRLSCERYGGPSAQHAAEMVYWNDIPSDDFGVSRYRNKNKQEQFLSFEPCTYTCSNTQLP
jgi:hypothetical protein